MSYFERRLDAILREQDELPDDWPSYAYVPGMGDVYNYGIDLEKYHRQVRLRPGEYLTWWATVVQPLEGDYEADSSVADYIRQLRKAGYDTHSCCSGAPHDHPWLVDEGELPHGYVSFGADDPKIRQVVQVAQAQGLRVDQLDDAYGTDKVVRVMLNPEDWPALVRVLLSG